MLTSDKINNLIIIKLKMKTLKTNYLGKKYLEQCPKITIKTLYDKIEKQIKKELLDVNLD
jgi:hypothetical protein